jgi:hypothetical protein
MCVRMPSAIRGIWQRAWRALTRSVPDNYRPEKHYMRGPGPKHREGIERNTGKTKATVTSGAIDEAKGE